MGGRLGLGRQEEQAGTARPAGAARCHAAFGAEGTLRIWIWDIWATVIYTEVLIVI